MLYFISPLPNVLNLAICNVNYDAMNDTMLNNYTWKKCRWSQKCTSFYRREVIWTYIIYSLFPSLSRRSVPSLFEISFLIRKSLFLYSWWQLSQVVKNLISERKMLNVIFTQSQRLTYLDLEHESCRYPCRSLCIRKSKPKSDSDVYNSAK